MNEKPMTKTVARRFLLGAVDDSERERIESLFIIDTETQETILIAEDELIEEYLEGSLSESEAAKFLGQYARGPRQRRKLRIAKSIREFAQAEAMRGETPRSPLQKVRNFLSLGWPIDRRVYIPIGVAVATVLVVGAVWLVQWNNHRIRFNNLQAAIEQELTELNGPSSRRDNPNKVFSLVLPSVSLRSINSPAEVRPQAVYSIVELHLLWPHQAESGSYVAVLGRVGGSEKFTVENLQAETNPAGKVVRLRFRTHSLTPGLYRVSLNAMASGSSGPTEEYQFVIGG